MSETKAAFRRRLGRLLHVMRTATTSATGTTTSFTAISLTDVYGANNSLNGVSAYDTAASEWRRVTVWLGTTGVATVNRAYTNSQANGRSLEIYEQFTPDDLDDALRMALVEAYEYLPSPTVDTSLTVVANQYEYTVPTTVRDLERSRGGRVQWQQNTAVSTFPYVDYDHWEIRLSGVTKTLIIPYISGSVGRIIRLIGW